ncbi:putative aminotransferase class IV, aminotransferase-like, PLP-dependent enzymes [Helianthus anomalus]
MKVLFFSTSKNVNYLPNVSLKLEVEEKGALASIWVDDDEYVAEHPNVNVGFVTHEKELILLFFDKILSRCTAKWLLKLAPKLVEKGGKVGELTMALSDLIWEDLVRRHTGSRFFMGKRNPNGRICGQNWCCILKSESE